MIKAVLDTNVVVQAVIGSPRSASHRVLRAYDAGKFRPVWSAATMDELLNVLALPHIRARLGWSDDEILDFALSLLLHADTVTGHSSVSAAIPRDVTDTKLLVVSAQSRADYLVTNDRRHLLPLKRFLETRIVTPARFLKCLG
jgi:putative PIN family toxin of toxin-antitoxin system